MKTKSELGAEVSRLTNRNKQLNANLRRLKKKYEKETAEAWAAVRTCNAECEQLYDIIGEHTAEKFELKKELTKLQQPHITTLISELSNNPNIVK